MSTYLEFNDKTGMYESITLEQWLKKDVETIIAGDTDSDYVEVVRCEDCKHCKKNTITGNYICYNNKIKSFYIRPKVDFCSYGERKE